MTPNKQTTRMRLDQAIHRAIHNAQTSRVIPCHLNPEGWFPEGSPDTASEAIGWCHTCPVLAECRTWAHTRPVEHNSSVIGGEWWSKGKTRPAIPERQRACINCGRLFRDRHLQCPTCRRLSTTGSFTPRQAA
jgi:hypothetical protein